jgi:hypothetical protein
MTLQTGAQEITASQDMLQLNNQLLHANPQEY